MSPGRVSTPRLTDWLFDCLTFSCKVTLTLIFRAAKALPISVSIYPLSKSELLRVNKKLTLSKALIRSILPYAWPA
jgi:hypothetical protein